ncbi:uncharacterized protein LOC142224866 [Haematobia irritans]|uniref:uncharacterized protein LOC142224866 n=1 Tax=Haematobia irritans TaxID=7368 RepID=UPI003F50A983
MDANQLSSLLKAMSEITTALKSQSTATTSVSIINKFDSFDPKCESFNTYIERLHFHFQIKGVLNDKDMCAKLLLQYIGSTTYSLLTTLAAPRCINELKYDEIVEILNGHFCPKTNTLVEQHKFLCEVRNEGQTINDFIAVLKKMSVKCGFICQCKKSVADIFLRSQFIRGIRIREQLLQTPEATFAEIVQKAKVIEAAKLDSKAMTSTSASDILQLRQSYSNRDQIRPDTSSRAEKSKRIDYKELGLEGEDCRKFYTTVFIEGKEQIFEVDSGAGFTLIPQRDFEELKIDNPVRKSTIAFRAYTGDVFVPLGVVDVNVKYKNKISKEQLYVVASKHSPLLGRERSKANENEPKFIVKSVENIVENYSEIYSRIPDVICSLKLQKDAKPVFVRERQVPYALREKVEKKL